MKKLKKQLLSFFILAILIIAGGCGGSRQALSTERQDKAVSLNISAAASLKDAMEDVKKEYAKEKSNVTITYNFGASGTLQQQIEQGAPADVFISAATKQMDALKKKNLLEEDTIKNLLENEVVLVAPKDSSAVSNFNDLGEEKVKKIGLGVPESVPAGQYGEEVLTNLKLMDKVKPKAVFAKDVKEVLTWVETKNVDAGIVYETDAKISVKVKIVAKAPEKTHKPIVYPAAVIKGGKNTEEAKKFMDFIKGDKGKAIFEKYGFKMAT